MDNLVNGCFRQIASSPASDKLRKIPENSPAERASYDDRSRIRYGSRTKRKPASPANRNMRLRLYAVTRFTLVVTRFTLC